MKKTTLFSFLSALCLLMITSQSALAQGKTSTDAHNISNEALKEYVGQYDPEGGQFFSITVSLDGDDRLMAQPTDKSQPNTLLSAKEKDKFDLIGTRGLVITFNRDDSDKITSLTFAMGGQSFTAKRKEE